MPQLDAISWYIWSVTIAVQIALAVVLVVRGCMKRWRAICAFVWFNALTSLALAGIILADNGVGNTIPAVYFRMFWAKQSINSILELWIVIEIGCNVAPAIAKILRRLIPSLAFVYLLGALFVSGYYAGQIVYIQVITIDRAVALAWLALFVTLAYGGDAMGVRWRRMDMGAASGFTLIAIAQTGTSWLMAVYHNWLWISNAHDVAWQIAFVVWIITFLRHRSSQPETEANPGELLMFAETLRNITRTIRKKPR